MAIEIRVQKVYTPAGVPVSVTAVRASSSALARPSGFPIGMLASNFSLGIDLNWVAQGYNTAQVTASGGMVSIAHDAAASVNFNRIESVHTYNLTGGGAFVQVPNYGNQALGTHEVFLRLRLDDSNTLTALAENGILYFRQVVGDVFTTHASITLNTTTHAWLRIREASGTIFWDTSSDGTTWTNRASIANPFPVTGLQAMLACGNGAAEASGSFATFDNFNVSVGQILVDVRTFGAVVNGVTDDTTAVQNAANASVGKTLYFPVGTCRIFSVDIPSGANVTGEGPTSIVRQLALPSFSDSRPVFWIRGGNVSITNIKVDGNRVANIPNVWSDSYNNAGRGYTENSGGRGRGYRCGIRAENLSGVTINSVELTEIAGAAIGTNMVSDLMINSCNVHDTDFEAFLIYGDVIPAQNISGTNVNVTNNTILNIIPPVAAGATQPNGIVISRSRGGSVSGNTCSRTDRNFCKLESCWDFLISNNITGLGTVGFPNFSFQTWLTDPTVPTNNCRVTGNTFSGPGFWSGIQINSGNAGIPATAMNIEIDNNTVNSLTAGGPPGSGTGHMNWGVVMDGGGLQNINIHDNFINNSAVYAIYVATSGIGTGLFLTNNRHNGTLMSNLSTPGAFSGPITQN